jgi:AP-3 complex subunit delta-1
LDLDAWINEPPEDSDSESDHEVMDNLFVKSDKLDYGRSERYQPEPTEEELRKSREARKYEQQNNPHYLKGSDGDKIINEGTNVDVIPVAEIDLSVPLKVAGQKRSDKYLNMNASRKKMKKKNKKKKHKSESSSDENVNEGPVVEVKRELELPEGATLSDSDSSHGHVDDPHRALNIDLELLVA